MSTATVKLQAITSQYDSALSKAGKELADLMQKAKSAGASFAYADQQEISMAKNLGMMATKSNTAAGKIAELTSALTSWSARYRQMSKEEKESDFGRTLASSIGDLRIRLADARAEMQLTRDEVSGNGGLGSALDAIAGKFGISIEQLTKFGGVLAAGTAALKVTKDAFFSTEEGVDMWGRTLQESSAAYDYFLDTLNGGNWTNFFSNLKDAINGAGMLYDKLDRLGSIKANNAAAIAIVQQELAQLRVMKQAGENVDAQIKSATERLKALQGMEVNAGKSAGVAGIKEELRRAYNSTEGAKPITDSSLTAVANQILKEGQKFFDKEARIFNALEKKATVNTVNFGPSVTGSMQQGGTKIDLSRLTDEERKQYILARAITQQESQLQGYISTYAAAVGQQTQTSRDEFRYNRWAAAGRSSGTGNSSSSPAETPKTEEQKLNSVLAELTEQYVAADEAERASIKTSIADVQQRIAAIKSLKEEALAPIEDSDSDFTFTPEQLEKNDEEVRKLTEDTWNWVESLQSASVKFNELTGANISGFTSSLKREMDNSVIGSDTYNSLQSQLADTNSLTGISASWTSAGLDYSGLDASGLWSQILNGDDIPDDVWEGLVEQINEKLAELEIDPIKIDVKTGNISTVSKQGKEMESSWKSAASAVQSVGSALQNVENPTAKIAGIVGEAIASIALTFAKSLTGTVTPWDWIAAAAAGTATMIATVASIKSVTKGYAGGGVVGGFNGASTGIDDQYATIKTGEMILNANQQKSLFDSIENGNLGKSSPILINGAVRGDTMFLTIDNYMRESGKTFYNNN